MHLRYVLHQRDGTSTTGDEWIKGGQTLRTGDQSFSNERRMLERWFQTRFAGK